ncbi:hypothetical protein CLOBY_08280 [Clostridium saccharobutylicum]|uniref:hypothetical protein n=1 Tax=Clostridium saccharobutylicum TaxID=169679 RepID=UPI000983D4FA|nr:hypothetical protein [Clostridium saccharobutylicum]AQS08718.1 hypothetical protein CLOBY_08280 [Clostridium saccharobutylicum]MBC2437243.1 hypothetical protein [Clostridium saccharobutylicum]NSB89626.1 hypothetical protein [Clostridium saccharobutylicum]NYC28937.1 hypothetical protein [Clostridium saccharobutylicum]OOM18514.1 hypothetical protein CLSAB_06290 [Clostridium saccharobutylicum]
MIKRADKNEVLKEFEEKYVKDRHITEFEKIIEKYKTISDIVTENLVSKFNSVCKEAILLQEKELKGEIMYIYFSILRTSILENKGQWRIDLYDEKWLLDNEECSVNIDLDFIYEPLFNHMKELSEKKKEYVHIKKSQSTTKVFQIKEKDIEYIKLREANKYHGLALNIIRDALQNFLECTSYEEMKKKEDITIMAGEYMDAAIRINKKHHKLDFS